LLPLVQDSFALPGSNKVVVLDPGHGGENPGTRSVLGRGYEKDFTLDWAHRLSPLLVANGWTVFLTRTNDTDLALSNRVAFADSHHADLFLSLHFNSSAPDEIQHGLETYCLTPVGMPSTVTRDFSDEVGTTFANNAFDAQNLEFAVRIHRALLQINGKHDRGIRRARFPGVLRNQLRPSILVEGGYLSNPGEAHLIATSGYRQKLAEAVALALGSRIENMTPVVAQPASSAGSRSQPSENKNNGPDEP
jgi:N-acetylmuramoyl-L-alanine amidase